MTAHLASVCLDDDELLSARTKSLENSFRSDCKADLKDIPLDVSFGCSTKDSTRASSASHASLLAVLERARAHVRVERGSDLSTRSCSSTSGSLLPASRDTVEGLSQSGSGSNACGKMLAVLEDEARVRRREIAELREHNVKLQRQLDDSQSRASSEDSTSGVARTMLATVRAQETEARKRLEDQLSQTKSENAWLQSQLEDGVRLAEREVRQSFDIQLDRYRSEINALRDENTALRAMLQKPEAEAKAHFTEQLKKLQDENFKIQTTMEQALAAAVTEARKAVGEDMAKLQIENARLSRMVEESGRIANEARAARDSLLSASSRSSKAPAAVEGEKADVSSVKRSMRRFLSEAYEPLSGARSACVQLEAALSTARKSGVADGAPPPLYDLQARDDECSLQMTTGVLRYITEVLLEVTAVESKWSRNFRYLVC